MTDIGAGGQPEGTPAGGGRRRKAPAARRAQLLDAAYEVLSAGGPAADATGMADVARAAGVSVGLLYHYFPGGRAELVEVLSLRLLDELCERVRTAADLPFSPLVRLEQALAALVAFFVDRPPAYRLLFPPDPADDADTADATDGEHVSDLARVRLVTVLTALIADPAWSADELVAAGGELVDRSLAEVARCLEGAVEPEAAWRASSRRARRLFAG